MSLRPRPSVSSEPTSLPKTPLKKPWGQSVQVGSLVRTVHTTDVVDFHPQFQTTTPIEVEGITKPEHRGGLTAAEWSVKKQNWNRERQDLRHQLAVAKKHMRDSETSEAQVRQKLANLMRQQMRQTDLKFGLSVQVIVPPTELDDYGTQGRAVMQVNKTTSPSSAREYAIWLCLDVVNAQTTTPIPEKTLFLLHSKKVGHSPWMINGPNADVSFVWEDGITTTSVLDRYDSVLVTVDDLNNPAKLKPLNSSTSTDLTVSNRPATRYIMKMGTMKCNDTSMGLRVNPGDAPKGPMQMTTITSLDYFEQFSRSVTWTPYGQPMRTPHESVTVMSSVRENAQQQQARIRHGEPVVYHTETAGGDDHLAAELIRHAEQLSLTDTSTVPTPPTPPTAPTPPPYALMGGSSSSGGMGGPSSSGGMVPMFTMPGSGGH